MVAQKQEIGTFEASLGYVAPGLEATQGYKVRPCGKKGPKRALGDRNHHLPASSFSPILGEHKPSDTEPLVPSADLLVPDPIRWRRLKQKIPKALAAGL